MKAQTSRGDQRPEVASRAFADSSTFWTGASQERKAVHSVHFKSKQDVARSDLPPPLSGTTFENSFFRSAGEPLSGRLGGSARLKCEGQAMNRHEFLRTMAARSG